MQQNPTKMQVRGIFIAKRDFFAFICVLYYIVAKVRIEVTIQDVYVPKKGAPTVENFW